MGAVARLGQLEPAAAQDYVLAESQEHFQRVLQAHETRPAGIECQEVHAEAGLHLGEAVQVVQHHLGRGLALQLDHDPHPIAVAFVPHVGDAFQGLGPDQFGDLLKQVVLVDLIRNFTDNKGLPVALHFLNEGFGPHHQAAAARFEGATDAAAAQDHAAGREIRARHDPHQVIQSHVRVFDQRQGGIDDFGRVVRRDIGGHAHGDAIGAVDQQVRVAGGEHLRLLPALVVAGLEIDGILVDVVQQIGGGAGQPRLGIPHRRRRIAIHRAEIALPVDQRHPHAERLRHAYQRIVDRGIPVRMILAHHVADHAGRLSIRFISGVAALVHREQDAPMHRLQPIPRIRQRPRDDDGHGIVEIRPPHLVFEHHRGIGGAGLVGGVGQCGVRCVALTAAGWLLYGPVPLEVSSPEAHIADMQHAVKVRAPQGSSEQCVLVSRNSPWHSI